ncbi:MAG: hypothetical protein SFU86_23185 [Pirellulaceae bacterium]|nr:hypothetical protein [Pirellulaceae bacterium]
MRRPSFFPLLLALFGASTALAQLPPLPKPGESQREANDQIEGTIFEYKGTPSSDLEKKDANKTLAGKFRIEGSAVLDVSPTFALPSKEEVKRLAGKVVEGKGIDLKLPAPPQQKRLGEFRKISGGKLRFDFNDKESLQGIMIIWKKKKTDDVYIGTFDEREGTKTVRKWDVEVRPIED